MSFIRTRARRRQARRRWLLKILEQIAKGDRAVVKIAERHGIKNAAVDAAKKRLALRRK